MSFNESNTVEQMILDALSADTTAGKCGRAHSRTLRAVRSSPTNTSRLGVRWPSTAVVPGGAA